MRSPTSIVSTPSNTSPRTCYHVSRTSRYLQLSYTFSKEYDYKRLITPLKSYSFAKVSCKPNAAYLFRKHPGVGVGSSIHHRYNCHRRLGLRLMCGKVSQLHPHLGRTKRFVVYIETTPRARFASKEASRSCVQH